MIEQLLLSLGVLATACAVVVLRALTVLYLWEWYVVSLGFQPIQSLLHAVGISVFIGLFKTTKFSTDDDDRLKHFLTHIANSIFALTLGWFLHLFM